MADIDNFGRTWQGLTHGQVEDAIKAKIAAVENNSAADKQDVLVSGTNIKTINSESVLGQGNIRIDSSGSDGTARSFIDTIQEKFDALIDALGNYAFPNGKNSNMKVGALPWSEDQGGGTTPSVLPVLTYPTSGSTVSVGTNTGSGVSKTVYVKGSNLTKALNVVASGSGFSVSPTTISAENANAGVNVTVTYNGTTASANGALTIISDEVVCTVNLTAVYSESVEPATPTLISPDDVSINLGTIAANDSSVSVQKTVQGENLTGNLSLEVTGTGFSVSPTTITPEQAEAGQTITITYTNSETQSSLLTATGSLQISGGGITTKTIALSASKEAESVTPEPTTGYVTDGLVLHLDGNYQGEDSGYWTERVDDSSYGTRKFQFTQNGVTAGQDGVTFNGESSSGALFTGVFDTDSDNTNDEFPMYNEGTIEIVFTPGSSFYSDETARPLFVTDKDEDIALMIHKSGTTQDVSFAVNGHYQGGTASGGYDARYINARVPLPSVIGSSTTPHVLSVTRRNVSGDDTAYRIMLDGQCVESTGATHTRIITNDEDDAGRLRLGSQRTNIGTFSDRGANVTIHAVRVYSDHLTEQEMLQNQQEDNRRYNLGITALND